MTTRIKNNPSKPSVATKMKMSKTNNSASSSITSSITAGSPAPSPAPGKGMKRSLPRIVTADEMVETSSTSSNSSNGGVGGIARPQSPSSMVNERFPTNSTNPRPNNKRARIAARTPQNVLISILYDNGMSDLTVSFDHIPKSFFFNHRMVNTCVTTRQDDFVSSIRRGDLEPLLQQENGGNKIRLRVVDSDGRSPLHDALRAINVKGCVVDMTTVHVLVKQCPELLFISDKFGKAPLSYITNRRLVEEFDSWLKSQSSWLTECAIRFALQLSS